MWLIVGRLRRRRTILLLGGRRLRGRIRCRRVRLRGLFLGVGLICRLSYGIRAARTFRKRLAKSIGNGEASGSPAGNDKVIAVEKVGGFALDEMLGSGAFCLGNDALGEKHRCQKRDGKGSPAEGFHGCFTLSKACVLCPYISVWFYQKWLKEISIDRHGT